MTSTVYVPQPSMDCAGGAPLHEQVSHYSRGKKQNKKMIPEGSGTCGCGWCQWKRNGLKERRRGVEGAQEGALGVSGKRLGQTLLLIY